MLQANLSVYYTKRTPLNLPNYRSHERVECHVHRITNNIYDHTHPRKPLLHHTPRQSPNRRHTRQTGSNEAFNRCRVSRAEVSGVGCRCWLLVQGRAAQEQLQNEARKGIPHRSPTTMGLAHVPTDRGRTTQRPDGVADGPIAVRFSLYTCIHV